MGCILWFRTYAINPNNRVDTSRTLSGLSSNLDCDVRLDVPHGSTRCLLQRCTTCQRHHEPSRRTGIGRYALGHGRWLDGSSDRGRSSGHVHSWIARSAVCAYMHYSAEGGMKDAITNIIFITILAYLGFVR